MKYLILAIINAVYGVLLLSTLSLDLPGFYLVLIIGLILTFMGLVGFILWVRMVVKSNNDIPSDHTLIKSWLSLVKSFDIVLVIGLLFKAFILQPFIVEGSSMEPNFHSQEIMLVDKISYRFREPQRGDVIIFKAPKSPGDDYIKRIVALPGETIQIAKGKVFINGMLLDENYLLPGQETDNGTGAVVFSKTLESNEYFTLGDNRSNSSDSRMWGVMPKANIIGRAWWNVYPFSSFDQVEHIVPVIEKNLLLKNYISAVTNYAHNF